MQEHSKTRARLKDQITYTKKLFKKAELSIQTSADKNAWN